MAGHVRLKIRLSLVKLLLLLIQTVTDGAVVAPPWANTKLNPCASQPRGWQLLFWPPDGKCYRIFKIGHPCPEDMELTPSVVKSGKNLSAECRCPPKTAQSANDGKCYELFTAGPCSKGYFYGPDTRYKEESSKRQWGMCKPMRMCSNHSMTYWPMNGECYQKLSRGPCLKGELLYVDKRTGIPLCGCDNSKELIDYRHANGNCYQHFTRGPCAEKGHLFLPDKTCGCHSYLPHYHEDTELCFELDTIGPCSKGQLFQLDPENPSQARCQCKPSYVPYQNSTNCYRPYTRGPCLTNEIITEEGSCINKPCPKAYMFFPKEKRCYRIGSRGPCMEKRIVTFDFNTRPSVDGISYNGVCGCKEKNCDKKVDYSCDRLCGVYSQIIKKRYDFSTIKLQTIEIKSKGLIRYKNECHKIYTQGPCSRGAWLVPKREPREELYANGTPERVGECDCIPGYTMTIFNANTTICLPPTVILAEFLNKNFTISQFL